MRWPSMRIESQLQTLVILDVDIELTRQTLTQLETMTWRVELREIDGDRFSRVAGRLAGASVLDRGRAACREAVERVRQLYGRATTAVD